MSALKAFLKDDDTELGVTVEARTGFDLSIWRGLALSVYLDGFLYRGQVESTREPGASLIGGFGLKYDRRLRLSGEE